MNTRRAPLLAGALLLALLIPGLRAQTPSSIAALDATLKKLSAFKGGLDSAAVWEFREAVLSLRADPTARAAGETRLLTFIRNTRLPAPARTIACRELRIIGGPATAAGLGAMLLDGAMTDAARYALEAIPGPEADTALLSALAKASGPIRIGIISSLGHRRTAEAAPPLAKILEAKAEAAVAAAQALGRIGGPAAEAALLAALSSPAAPVKAAAASAVLECAEGSLRAGRREAGARLYEKILSLKPDASLRRAATAGRIAAAGPEGAAILLEILRAPDEVAHEAALARARETIPDEGVGPLVALLPSLPEASRIKLLAVLAVFPKDRVRTAVLESAAGPSMPVKIAALNALASVGDASCVAFLAEQAASSSGDAQAAARSALGSIPGREVDAAILAALEKEGTDEVRSELVTAVGERRIFAGKGAMIGLLASSSGRIRLQALKVLKVVGSPSDIPALLSRDLSSIHEAELEEVENTIAALAFKIAQPVGRARAVLARLPGESDPARRAFLFRVLGKIGDDSSLPAIREALEGADAAIRLDCVRALSAWPTLTPIDDIRGIAKTPPDETSGILALRGFIRMTAAGKYRRSDLAVLDLREALAMSSRAEEKRLILAALPDFAGPDALRTAEALLGDADVKAEAEAAVKAIKARLQEKSKT